MALMRAPSINVSRFGSNPRRFASTESGELTCFVVMNMLLGYLDTRTSLYDAASGLMRFQHVVSWYSHEHWSYQLAEYAISTRTMKA